jgi:hypothetical protein
MVKDEWTRCVLMGRGDKRSRGRANGVAPQPRRYYSENAFNI